MRAMVMAAGIGTRLRPLTHVVPKPMIPIVNKPVMEHTIELLKKYGIEEIVINLHLYPEKIKNYFQDGSKWGVKIHYSYEPRLMGTAGGVKKVEKFFTDTFLVTSGDGITDIDFKKVLDFHHRKKALGTMVLKGVDTRFEYGVTLTDKNGRIKKFVEKPAWSDVFSNTVNTGIYVFEPEIFQFIPAGKFYDFGKNLWPLLLKKKKPIFGYPIDNYWCDIGNLQEYKRAEHDALAGKIKVKIPGELKGKKIWIGKNTKIPSSVKIKPPVVIGDNCTIEPGVIIGEFTTIGSNSFIERKAELKDCILWNNIHVAKGVCLKNCIIGEGAYISENISVFEGSVINIRKE